MFPFDDVIMHTIKESTTLSVHIFVWNAAYVNLIQTGRHFCKNDRSLQRCYAQYRSYT